MLPDESTQDGRFTATATPPAFRHLVGLAIEQRANRIESIVPLRLTLTADSHVLEVAPPRGSAFRQLYNRVRNVQATPVKLLVRLRSVYVRYTLSGCRIAESSRAAQIIDPGKYATSEITKSTSFQTLDATGKASASLGASLTSLQASFSLSASAAPSHVHKEERVSHVKLSTEVASVLPVVAGWRIGDPNLGDPRKPDGCLAGQYLAEPGDRDTCHLHVDASTAEARFDITVRDTGIHVSRADGAATASTDKCAALAAMRDRLAAIALEKALPRHQDEASGEQVLATVACTIDRAPDAPIMPQLPPSSLEPPRPRRKRQTQ